MKQSFTVRDLPRSERPRERLQQFGEGALSAQELLQLVLGRGVSGESVATTTQKLLARFGSLQGVTQASLEDLQAIRGIGLAKASQLKACMEIARRSGQQTEILAESAKARRKAVVSPAEVYRLVSGKISNYAKEHFLVLSFDVRNNVLGIDTVSVGTLTQSLVHPRETYHEAIRRHASHIILVHNHPSNNTNPSDQDIEMTRRLRQAGDILGIQMLDHVIVGQFGFTSLKDQRIL